MSDFVSAPPPSGGIDYSAHKGALLVVEPLSVEVGVKTVHGDKDPVKANVHVLTGATESEDYLDTLIFPAVLCSQLKGQIGRKVVGRLGQGVAKPGQSAPWLLEEATAEDLGKAKTWLDARKPALSSAQAPF